MSENARTGRAPVRGLILILGLLLVTALGAGAVAVQARAQSTPPEELTEEELLSRITAARENAPDFSATATVEQTLVPEGLLGASQGDNAGNSGPRSARIWHGGPDKLRAELQGKNGDQIFVKNGSEVRSYDGATNTLRTGEKPEPDGQPEEAASPEKINEILADISPTSDLKTGPPEEFAGRWAYPLTLEPKDKSQTLVDKAEALVDAETFVPLSFDLYAQNTPDPVVRYEASDFKVGDVPDERFQLETPPGATVVSNEESGSGEGQGEKNGEEQGPQTVASVAEAQKSVSFPVKQLAGAPGGRELTEIRVAGSDGVIQTYGSGWGAITLVQKTDQGSAEDTDALQGESSGSEADNNGRGKQSQVPTVDLGGGVEAKEISTPIGTALSWNADGVSYSLVGSVPAADLEEAARGLLAGP